MTTTQFIFGSLVTAYVLGWVFGSIFKFFSQLVEVST